MRAKPAEIVIAEENDHLIEPSLRKVNYNYKKLRLLTTQVHFLDTNTM